MGGFGGFLAGGASGAATGAPAGPFGAIAGAILGFANSALSSANTSGGLFANGANVQAKAEGAMITNHVEGGMDFNRLAFISGAIPISEFEKNYSLLWQTLLDGAVRVAAAGTSGARDYAARMVSDRDYGGTYAFEWRGIMHDDLIEKWFPPEKLDPYGYVLSEYQEAWPLKSRYMETGTGPLPGTLPELRPSPGQTGQQIAPSRGPGGSSFLKYAALAAAAVGGFVYFRR